MYSRSLLLFAFIFVSACSVSSPGGKTRALDTMSETKASVLQGQRQMDKAIVALNKLADSSGSNRRDLQREFQMQLIATEAQAEVIRDHLASLQNQGRSYFSNWDRDIRNLKTDQVKRVSRRQRDQAKASFDRIYQQVNSTKEAFRPMMATLYDIDSYLKNDSSDAMIGKIRPLVRRTTDQSEKVKQHVRDVVHEIDHVWLGLAQRSK